MAETGNRISTLMGNDVAIWTQALRQTSSENLAALAGDWNDPLKPFVPDFAIPRRASVAIFDQLLNDSRLILVEGPPLIGKSSVLRELTLRINSSEEFVPFFLEIDAGSGLFQCLADVLNQALNWPVTRDEVRDWLRRLSCEAGPALVVLIDGFGLNLDEIRRDIDDLSSNAFGDAVRLVVALDDTVAERIVLNSTKRNSSAIGRRANRVQVGPLNDEEFAAAANELWRHRAGLMNGAVHSPEFRIPWVLRAAMSEIVSRPQYADEKLAASIPPLLGMNLITHVRKRFDDAEMRRQFQAIAKAVLEESQDRKRSVALTLESIGVFIFRRDTLSKFLDRSEIDDLIATGYLKPGLHDSKLPILSVRIPELAASEVAFLLAEQLTQRAQADGQNAARWLSDIAASIPLGDIIAAQAIIDAAVQNRTMPRGLIDGLFFSPPREEFIKPGTKVAMQNPDAGVINIAFREQGEMEMEVDGQLLRIPADQVEQGNTMHADIHGWLILSHLCTRPFAQEDQDGYLERLDMAILLEVGACPMVLRRPGPNALERGILTHHVSGTGSMVCRDAGIVEPITLSIFHFLSWDAENAEEWVEEAAHREALPLLTRINIALRELTGSADTSKADFARRMLSDTVEPAMSQLFIKK
ncbi:MAG: hypothetical protein ACFCUR_21165 [Rhodomicrobiaceae bacterium]